VILALLLSAALPQPGRLVVLVVVDQLRAGDLTWIEPQFGPKGFAGLGRPAQLRYDTVVTETAADHAVLSTGAYADLNGIVGNRFYEGGRERQMVDDPACPVWGAPKLGRSAASLRVPTVGDAYKLNTNGAGRVVTVGIKDRSALFLGGTSADLALWFEVETGELASTSCYAPGPPAWVPQHPAAQFLNWVWTLGRPDAVARLVPQEESQGAVPQYDLGRAFPHKVGAGVLDKRFFQAVRNSPASTTLLLQAARAAVQGMALGQSGKTDFLAVAPSAVDGVGHQFGSLSRERVDTVLRMHDELGAFLDELRARLGPRLSVVLTSDHGLTPTEADSKRLRVLQGGTENIDEVIQRVNHALEEELRPRPEGWVLGIENGTLALRPPFPERAVQVAVETLRREPGFWRVVPAGEIASAEPVLRHAWFAERSGQILLAPRPLWSMKKPADAADHGSPWNDDALVPLLVQAPGFRLRREPVFRATQVAPMLAALLETAPPAAALDEPAIEHE
jgi:hypothetical protein